MGGTPGSDGSISTPFGPATYDPTINDYRFDRSGVASPSQNMSTQTTPSTQQTYNPAAASGVQFGNGLSDDWYSTKYTTGNQFPTSMPGGGGAVVGNYGQAAWTNGYTPPGKPYTYAPGADPYVNWGGGNSYLNTPAGMYNPYLGKSGVMPAFGPVNNPGAGFDPSINSYADEVGNYLQQYRNLQPTYSQNPPTADTSPGSPFAGQQVVHGNTAGWQSAGGDYVGTPLESYQAAPGTQTDVASPMAPSPIAPSPIQNPMDRMRGGRHYGRDRNSGPGGNGYGYSRYPDWAQGLLSQKFDPNAGGIDPKTGQYVNPSQAQWDAHMIRQINSPQFRQINADGSYMSPEAKARMMRTLQQRYQGLYPS